MIIGVTDSGIGGLNVLAALIKRRCGDGYLYLADGANLPYGSKSADELRQIALKSALTLERMGANVIVFGCNTLSVTALEYVRQNVKAPVFGLRPRPELLSGKALLMTTPTTALYLSKIEPNVSLLTPRKLASLIDEEYPSTERVRAYLSPLLLPYGEVERVYLGCSHYLYAKNVVSDLMPHAAISDGTESLADLIHAVLPPTENKHPSVAFRFTGKSESERYARILTELIG